MFNDATRHVILCGVLAAVAAAEQADTAAVQKALQNLVVAVRNAEGNDLQRFLAPALRTPTAKADIASLFKMLQNPPSVESKPMSETSAPIVWVDSIIMDGGARSKACVTLRRVGSVTSEILASYDVVAAKNGNEWRLLSAVPGGRCPARGFLPFHVPNVFEE